MKVLSLVILTTAAALAQTAPAAKKAAAPAGAASTTTVPAREPGLYVTLNTTMGKIVFKLYEKEVPGVVNNFVALARGTKLHNDAKGNMVKTPMYNGVTFHRVIPGFMIQTGDPTGSGMHNCGFTVKDEIVSTLKYDKPGVVGLARTAMPNSGSCQFFITDAAYPSLDNQYTVFGQVVEGQDVVHKIANVQRDPNDKPLQPIKITTAVVTRVGPAPAPAAKKSSTPAKKGVAPATKKAAPAAPKQ